MSSLLDKNSVSLKKGDPEPSIPDNQARIFSMRFCPYAERALIYIAKKKIPTKIVNINLKDKPEWYFAKNPKGSVPTFELEGKIVFESLIVPDYLDAIFPETSISPSDPYTRARHRIIVQQLSNTGTIVFNLFMMLKMNKSEEDCARVLKTVESTFDECEGYARDNAPFFAGEQPGFPDYMSISFFERLWVYLTAIVADARPTLSDQLAQYKEDDFPGKARWPKLTTWFHAMMALDEVKEAQQPRDVLIAFTKTYIADKPEYDIGA